MDKVEFIDQGANFESVRCGFCLKDIEMDWWSEEMEKAYQKDFSNLSITTPCCKEEASLNSLDYIWPAGFARYIIEILNPDEDQVEEVERIVEMTDKRLIRAHY